MFTTKSSAPAISTVSGGFATSEAHLAAEIAWVAQLLRLAILQEQGRARRDDRFDEFSGLFVSEQDIARFFENGDILGEGSEPRPPGETGERIEEQERRVAEERVRIDQLVSAALERGAALRLPHLIERFALTDAQRTTFLCCLAPDLDDGLQKCFAYLQNDVSRKRPSIGLLTGLCRAGRDPLAPWRLFGADSTLFQHKLLDFSVAAGPDNKPFPAQEPRVPQNVIGYLAGNNRTDDLLGTSAVLVSPRPLEVEADYYRHHRAIVKRLLSARQSRGTLPLSYIWGPDGCDKSMVVEALAHDLGLELLRLDCKRLSADQLSSENFRRVLMRDIRLHGCLLHLVDLGYWQRDAKRGLDRLAILKDFLQAIQVLDVVLSGEEGPARLRSDFDFSFTDYEGRVAIDR